VSDAPEPAPRHEDDDRLREHTDRHDVDDVAAATAELESGPPFDDDAPPPAPRPRPSVARGGMLAAAMFGLRDVLEGPKKEVVVVQVEAPGEPPDIDHTGLRAELEDGSVATGPPLDELKSTAGASRRTSRARRRAARRR
jgi:hypothetical protein